MRLKTACALAVGFIDVITFGLAIHVHRTELHSFKEDALFSAAAFFTLLFLWLVSGDRCYFNKRRSINDDLRGLTEYLEGSLTEEDKG